MSDWMSSISIGLTDTRIHCHGTGGKEYHGYSIHEKIAKYIPTEDIEENHGTHILIIRSHIKKCRKQIINIPEIYQIQ